MMSQCPRCQELFENNTNRTYCSRSCANSREYTDARRKKLLDTISKKTTIKNQFGDHPRQVVWDYTESYTKIYLCTCKYSGKKWYSPTVKTVHPDLARTRSEYGYSCRFQFGISSYPEWFVDATELINQYGWYSTPGSRNGITNVNGISRDHLYSISDGWKNNIPAHVIRHPANCELMPHKQNQSKHRKSKITIEELYERINAFEEMYGDGRGNRTRQPLVLETSALPS